MNNLFKLNLQFFGDQSGTADAADATDTSATSADTGTTGDTSSTDSSSGGGGTDPGVTNTQNERDYLSGLVSNGDPGQAAWAQNQLDALGPSPDTTGTTGTTTAPSSGGSIVDPLLSAIQNPQATTTWNTPSGQQFETPVYNGRSVTTMSNLASTLGIDYSKQPGTTALTVNGKTVNPVGIDATGTPIVNVRDVLNAMGVPDQSIQYDAKTGNVSYTAPQSKEQPQQRNPYQPQPYQMQMPYIGSMPQMAPTTPFQAPDLSMYYNNLMPMQQQFTPDWNTYYQQAHQQFDPTTTQSYNQLLTKMNSDISSVNEKMNQRGIFNSGLAQSAEDDVRAKSSDAIAKVLATSQSNIAKVAQQLYKDAQTAWYQGNDIAIKNNQLMLNQALDQEKQAYTQWLGGQNLNLNQYKAALSAWDNAANVALKQAQMSLDAYKFNNLSADQAANLNQRDYQYNNLSAQQKVTDQIDQQKNNMELWKMLGYVQNPDGTMTPTEQATVDKQNLAIKLAQTLGYVVNPDGTITQTEQARHDMAQDVLNQQKLAETTRHDKQLESIDWTKASISQQQLNETVNNNITKAKEFAATMKNSQLKEQVNALTKQMQDSNGNLKSLYDRRQKIIDAINATTDTQQKQNLQSEIDDPTNGIRQQIAQEMANLKNAQDGINQRLQLDPSSQDAGNVNFPMLE